MESALPKSKRRLVIACEREINWFGEYRMLNVRQLSGELGKTLTLAYPIMAGQVGQMLALIGHRCNACHTACFASTMFLFISSTASRSGSGSTFHGDSWLVSCTRFGVYERQNLLRVSV
jgi:hypothetical protein